MTATVTVRAGYNPVLVTHTKADGPLERLLAQNDSADFELQQDEEISAKIEMPVEAPPPAPPPPPARQAQERHTRERK
jgi:hypothetical protein